MEDLSAYLLRTQDEVLEFKRRFGGRLEQSLDGIGAWLSGLPDRRWTDYTRNISPEKVRNLVGLLCIWMNERSTEEMTIDFNHPTAHLIKVRKYDFTPIAEKYERMRHRSTHKDPEA